MESTKKQGRCEACEKSPRVLWQISSGHWVCRTCRSEIRKGGGRPKHPAEDWQLEKLEQLGIDVADNISKSEASAIITAHEPPTENQIRYAVRLGFTEDVLRSKTATSRLLDAHKEARYYVRDAWKALTGKYPSHAFVDFNEVDRFVAELVMDPALGPAIASIEQARYDAAFDRSRALQRPNRSVDFRECFPPLEEDATFRQVRHLLRSRFPDFLTEQRTGGFLARLFGI